MKEKPILFSGPMVRAILEGRKSQTRRIVKINRLLLGNEYKALPSSNFPCPHGLIGDRLWVKETFKYLHDNDSCVIQMRADGHMINVGYATEDSKRQAAKGHWKPCIFMPRWASRITLEIVSVRVERLESISDADAVAEGIEPKGSEWKCYNADSFTVSPKISYKTLWESINGKGSWDFSPWVWVIEFKRL